MNVQTLCLAILHDRDATGYEIRKMCTEGEYGFFVEASFGSIYPALSKLEKAGQVEGRVEVQDGRPSKKVYQITDTGREEFQRDLSAPIAEDVHRSEFLMFARFAHLMPAELVAQRVDEHLAYLAQTLTVITSLVDCPRENDWVLRHAVSVLSHMQGYIGNHKQELVEMAKDSDPSTTE